MYLTRRQKEILDFIGEYVDRYGYAPSIEEICEHFDLSSTATVHKHLINLESKGLISRSSGRSRSIEINAGRGRDDAEVPAAVHVPLLGRIAAGRPIEAINEPEQIVLPEEMLGRGRTYVLKVDGNSMIDEQIRSGDYVIVESRDTASDGEVVVALVDGSDATLKAFYRQKDGRIRLQPANPAIDPIIVDESSVQVQGVVIGVLRKYKRLN